MFLEWNSVHRYKKFQEFPSLSKDLQVALKLFWLLNINIYLLHNNLLNHSSKLLSRFEFVMTPTRVSSVTTSHHQTRNYNLLRNLKTEFRLINSGNIFEQRTKSFLNNRALQMLTNVIMNLWVKTSLGKFNKFPWEQKLIENLVNFPLDERKSFANNFASLLFSFARLCSTRSKDFLFKLPQQYWKAQQIKSLMAPAESTNNHGKKETY